MRVNGISRGSVEIRSAGYGERATVRGASKYGDGTVTEIVDDPRDWQGDDPVRWSWAVEDYVYAAFAKTEKRVNLPDSI
ncbi:MAG: hypothetical protein ACLU3U_04765 [Gallintestinimicrobium sp.]